MKRIPMFLSGGSLAALLFFSCQQVKPMDAATMQKKADSVYNAKMHMVDDSMMKVCNSQTPMKVMWYADSLYNAKIDSLHAAKK